MWKAVQVGMFLVVAVSQTVARNSTQDPNADIEFKRVAVPADYQITHLWQTLGYPSSQFLKKQRFEMMKFIGITAVVSYVHWSEVERNGPDDTRFDTYVGLRAALKQSGVKWTPVLMANPMYSTPAWFRNSGDSVPLRCLEHDIETPVQSIWNPHLRPHIRRFLRKTAEFCHRDRDSLGSIRLGFCGKHGEAGFPVEPGLDCPDSTHAHAGWWAGDEYAREDFRRWLTKKYGSAERVAATWDISIASVGQIATCTGNLISLPNEPLAGKPLGNIEDLDEVYRHRFSDFINWYEESVTDYVGLWLRESRQFFPGDRIDIVVPGDEERERGVDLASLAKTARDFNAGVWCIAMNDDFLDGFVRTRLLSSAARGYGIPYGTEERIQNSERGVPGRFFNTLSGGAKGLGFRGLFDIITKYSTASGRDALETYYRCVPSLRRSSPAIPVAVFYPGGFLRRSPDHKTVYFAWLKRLRDQVDFDVLDETMIQDGLLKNYRVFVCLPMSPVNERIEEALRRFVEDGGVEVVHAGQVAPDELTDERGRTKTLSFRSMGRGYRAVYGLPSEQSYADFERRLLLLLDGERFPWEGVLSPDGERDGVYSTRLGDGSIALYNGLPTATGTEIKHNEGSQVLELGPLELRVITEPGNLLK